MQSQMLGGGLEIDDVQHAADQAEGRTLTEYRRRDSLAALVTEAARRADSAWRLEIALSRLRA